METHSEKRNILFINNIRNAIDLDPAFQRGVVWSESKRQSFIDTLLKDWGVPKIYLAAYKDKDGAIYKYECIDGKQRLTTVFDFFDDNLKIIVDGEDKTYNDLSLDVKEKLSKYEFDVEIVEDFQGYELSELFLRLQTGSVLNTSEKLRATTGEMSEFIYEQSKGKLFTEKIVSKAKRNPHLATVAQVSLLSIKNQIVNLKFKDLSGFLKTYIKFNKEGEEARKIKNIISYINDNFSVDEAGKVFTNRAMFVSCFYLISYLMLRGDISKLKIKDFFIDFVGKLSSKSQEAYLKDFQIAVVQSADSSSSIKTRHKILISSLVKFDKNVGILLNYETLEDEFKLIYYKKLKKFSGEHKKLEKKLVNLGCRLIKLTNGREEPVPIYIRHKNEHPNTKRLYSYTDDDLKYAISFLDKIN